MQGGTIIDALQVCFRFPINRCSSKRRLAYTKATGIANLTKIVDFLIGSKIQGRGRPYV